MIQYIEKMLCDNFLLSILLIATLFSVFCVIALGEINNKRKFKK